MTSFSIIIAVSAVLSTTAVWADSVANTQSDYAARYEPAMRAVSRLELPAKAASLVKQAKADQKENVAIALVRVVSKINPAAIPPVVGAIGRAEPSVASKILAEARKLQPTLSRDIKTALPLDAPLLTDRPTGVGNPSPTTRAASTDPTPSDMDQSDHENHGKHKGHYKNP